MILNNVNSLNNLRTVATGILFETAIGGICLGVGFTSLGINACIQLDNDCILPWYYCDSKKNLISSC